MKTKRILAASTAALLAFGTTAAYMASADEATTATAKTDDYTLELVPGTYETKTEGKTTAHITASLKNSVLAGLIAPDANIVKANVPAWNDYTLQSGIAAGDVLNAVAADDDKYAYTNGTGDILASTNGLCTETDIAIANGITDGLQLVKITDKGAQDGASVEGTKISLVKEFVGIGSANDKANPYNNLAMGLNFQTFTPTGGTAQDVLSWDDFQMTNIKMTANLVGEGTDKSNVGGATSEKTGVERKATASCTFADIKGKKDANIGTGANKPTGINEAKSSHWVTAPQGMKPSFGLSDSKTLDTIKTDDCEILVEFDIEMSNSHWKDVISASGITWNTTDDKWDNLDFEKLLNEKGDVLLATFLGVEGSASVNWAKTAVAQVGTMAMTSVSSTKATNVKAGDDEVKSNANWFLSGVTQSTGGGAITSNPVTVQIGLGTARNNVLKNLNNGGVVTFEFDKDIRSQDVFNPYIIWSGNSGTPVNMPLTLTNTYDSDAKSLSLAFPAGLTWAEGNTNFYNSFKMTFNLNYQNILNDTNVAMPPVGNSAPDASDIAAKNSFFATGKDATKADNYGAKLVKITFKANGAPASSTNSGSTGTNSGNGGSGSTNPETGIALAIAPVVLAAGAVAVVALKKKH